MRVHKPGTNQTVTITLHANNQPCAEYILLPANHPNPNLVPQSKAIEIFVPLPADDAHLTVSGSFTGTVSNFRIDCLADGSFVLDRLVEGDKGAKPKAWDKRKFDMKSFMHVPEPGVAARLRRAKVVEGDLVARRLSPGELRAHLLGKDLIDDDATELGLGSLALIVSLNSDPKDTYDTGEGEAAYGSNTMGTWRHVPVENVRDSGIPAEHELTLQVYPDGDPVREKKAATFWRDFEATRFGSDGPWCTVVFYYRTQAAIDKAGCRRAPPSFALPVFEGVFDEEAGIAVKETTTKKRLGIGQPLVLPSAMSTAATTTSTRSDEPDGSIAGLAQHYRSSAAGAQSRLPRSPSPAALPKYTMPRSVMEGDLDHRSIALNHIKVEPDLQAIDDDPFLDPDLFAPTEPTATNSPRVATPSKRAAASSTPPSSSKRARTTTPSSVSAEPSDISAKKAAVLARLAAQEEAKAAAAAHLQRDRLAREQQLAQWQAEQAEQNRIAEEAAQAERLRAEEAEAERLLAEENEEAERQRMEEEDELAKLMQEAEEADQEAMRLEAEREEGRREWEDMLRARGEV